MKVPKSWWGLAAVWLSFVAVLPLVADWLRGPPTQACALDGMQVDPSQRVRVVDAYGSQFQFCSLACAEYWIETSGAKPVAIYATDEMTGQEIDAASAFYVRSSVVSHVRTQENRHVFAREADAKRHAELFHGRMLQGEQRPFASQSASAE